MKKNEEADTTAPRGSPPCRILRRDAAATKRTTQRSEHRIRATRRLTRSGRHDITTRGGLAASAVGLHLSRLRTGASPHPPHNSTPKICFRSRRRSGEQRCPAPPGYLSNSQAIVTVSTSPRCFTLTSSHYRHSSKLGKLLAPSSDVVPHQEATARLSNPPQSATSQVVP